MHIIHFIQCCITLNTCTLLFNRDLFSTIKEYHTLFWCISSLYNINHVSLSLHMYIMYQYAWCIKHYLYDCFCFMYYLHRSCAFLLSHHDLNTNIAICTLQTRANVRFQSDPLVSLLIYDNLWSIKCGQDSILVRSISCCVTKKHCTQACMFIQCDVSFCRVHATHIGHIMPMARLEFIVLVCCFGLNGIL